MNPDRVTYPESQSIQLKEQTGQGLFCLIMDFVQIVMAKLSKGGNTKLHL